MLYYHIMAMAMMEHELTRQRYVSYIFHPEHDALHNTSLIRSTSRAKSISDDAPYETMSVSGAIPVNLGAASGLPKLFLHGGSKPVHLVAINPHPISVSRSLGLGIRYYERSSVE